MNKRWMVPTILAAYVFVLQLLLNIDSYLWMNNGHYDSACFFMAGKALMNGLTAYDQFADSKGLLLWAIYGIGYLIHPHSYVGVFWMACVFYWAAFCIAYRSARLFLPRTYALLASMSMALPLWYWNFYTEGKAEHFCTPFVAWGLYVLVRQMRLGADRRDLHRTFVLGAAWVCVLMLKWSVGVMMLSLLVGVGIYAVRLGTWRRMLAGFCGGVVAAFLPFAVYFSWTASWDDMWREYVVNTFATVSMPLKDTLAAYLGEWLHLFSTRRIVYVLAVMPLLLLWRKKEWFVSALPFLCAMFFVALSIRHDQFGHYITAAAPFTLAAMVAILVWWRRHGLRLGLYVVGLSVGLCYIVWGKIHYADCFITESKGEITRFESIGVLMAQVPKPTVLNIGQERGYAMGYTLPACRYWITQMGRTEQMLQQEVDYMKSGQADFVLLHGADLIRLYESDVLAAGYRCVAEDPSVRIYSKHSLKPVSAGFEVTWQDILFKRNVIDRELNRINL
ncbi:MAG: hypothetical protein ACI36X_05305 [Bacteroidaceae bacterium]